MHKFNRINPVFPHPTQQISRSFNEFDLSRLPFNSAELKANPPSAWSPAMDQIFMRSMSFTEYEMTSHPILILTVQLYTTNTPLLFPLPSPANKRYINTSTSVANPPFLLFPTPIGRGLLWCRPCSLPPGAFITTLLPFMYDQRTIRAERPGTSIPTWHTYIYMTYAPVYRTPLLTLLPSTLPHGTPLYPLQRVSLLLHDNCDHSHLDPHAILNKIYTKFPPSTTRITTRMLAINSLPRCTFDYIPSQTHI